MILDQTKKATTIIRSGKGKKSIEANSLETLISKDKELEDFFDVKQIDLVAGGEPVKRDVVYCTDVEKLIDHILKEKRNRRRSHYQDRH